MALHDLDPDQIHLIFFVGTFRKSASPLHCSIHCTTWSSLFSSRILPGSFPDMHGLFNLTRKDCCSHPFCSDFLLSFGSWAGLFLFIFKSVYIYLHRYFIINNFIFMLLFISIFISFLPYFYCYFIFTLFLSLFHFLHFLSFILPLG